MSIKSMTFFIAIVLIFGIIAGLVTRNIFIGIAFPILLILFIIMWRYLGSEKEVKDIDKEEEKSAPPPLSVNMVSKQPVSPQDREVNKQQDTQQTYYQPPRERV